MHPEAPTSKAPIGSHQVIQGLGSGILKSNRAHRTRVSNIRLNLPSILGELQVNLWDYVGVVYGTPKRIKDTYSTTILRLPELGVHFNSAQNYSCLFKAPY